MRITFDELTHRFVELNLNNLEPEFGYIVFKDETFDKDYSEYERTYKVSSESKFFKPYCIGNSLRGSSLDMSDVDVRLDYYIKDEQHPWIIDYCYLQEDFNDTSRD